MSTVDGWEFHPDPPHIHTIFGIPIIQSISESRECSVEGVSNLSMKRSVYRELSHFEGE